MLQPSSDILLSKQSVEIVLTYLKNIVCTRDKIETFFFSKWLGNIFKISITVESLLDRLNVDVKCDDLLDGWGLM